LWIQRVIDKKTMYADDSVMCCLFPSQCNMYHQTTLVIFWEIMEYLNMMMVIISPIIIVWSIVKIALKLLEVKFKLILSCIQSNCSFFTNLKYYVIIILISSCFHLLNIHDTLLVMGTYVCTWIFFRMVISNNNNYNLFEYVYNLYSTMA